MTVKINALLYSPNHARDRLERALQIEALSPGWRASFEALLQSQNDWRGEWERGARAGSSGASGCTRIRPLAVTAINHESADVLSLTMQSRTVNPANGSPGQYVVLRLQRTAGGPPLFRSYSLSVNSRQSAIESA